MALGVDWAAYAAIPGPLEAIGIALIPASITGLSAWDGIADFIRNRKTNRGVQETTEL